LTAKQALLYRKLLLNILCIKYFMHDVMHAVKQCAHNGTYCHA